MIPPITVVYAPLIMIQIYLCATLFLYAAGPVSFQRINPELVVVLVLVYIFSFSIGYLMAAWIRLRKPIEFLNNNGSKVSSLLLPLAAVYALFSLYTYVPGFTITSYFFILRWAVTDPLGAYQVALNNVGSPMSNYLIVILYPLYFYAIVRSLLSFSFLRIDQRVLLCAVLFLELSRWVMMGRNKGVFDILFIIGTVLLVKWVAGPWSENKLFVIKKRTFWVGTTLVAALLLVLNYFSNSIASRKAFIEDYKGYESNILVQIAPKSLTPLVVNITDYLGQGYHSLSHVFDMNWLPLYGVGHSPVLMANLGEYFGVAFEQSYQHRMSYFGIDPYVNWHSAFLWLANDLHWAGVSIFMMLFGFYFFCVYFDSIMYANTVSCCILALQVISIFYLPANVQIFTQTATLFSFYIFFFYDMARKARFGVT